MRKNKYVYFFSLIISLIFVAPATAQTITPQTEVVTPGSPSAAPNAANKTKTKKKIKINFEDETITGNYDVPDTLFLNSRRLIKYKELFNKRTNFIEEIESNKGLFNEHQK